MARVRQLLDCNEDDCADLRSCEVDPITLKGFTNDMKQRTIRLRVANALRCYDVESLYNAVRTRAVEPTTQLPFTQSQLSRLQRAHERLHPLDEKTGANPLQGEVPPRIIPEFRRLINRGRGLAEKLTDEVMRALEPYRKGPLVHNTIWARVFGSYHDESKAVIFHQTLDRLKLRLRYGALFILTPEHATPGNSPEFTLWLLSHIVELALKRKMFPYERWVDFLTYNGALDQENLDFVKRYDYGRDGIGRIWDGSDSVKVALKAARRFLDKWNRYQDP